jgi:ADP-heptose:LPS heptosyltransferase
VAWYSLQVGAKRMPPLPSIMDLGPLLGTFADTAYALSGLDLLIGVDTSVAHLAGALGVPTFLLLSQQPDYRWMLGREDSPWYPSLRLLRQRAYGDWASVMDQVLRDLRG